MTDLLQQVFAQASKLPPQEQDAIAAWLLRELEAESRWHGSFAQSQEALSKLGSEALAEHRQGNSQELHPDEL